jgi:hypothetical protein
VDEPFSVSEDAQLSPLFQIQLSSQNFDSPAKSAVFGAKNLQILPTQILADDVKVTSV